MGVTGLVITLVLVSPLYSMVIVVVVPSCVMAYGHMLLVMLLVDPIFAGSICISIGMGVVRSPPKFYWCSLPYIWLNLSLVVSVLPGVWSSILYLVSLAKLFWPLVSTCLDLVWASLYLASIICNLSIRSLAHRITFCWLSFGATYGVVDWVAILPELSWLLSSLAGLASLWDCFFHLFRVTDDLFPLLFFKIYLYLSIYCSRCCYRSTCTLNMY